MRHLAPRFEGDLALGVLQSAAVLLLGQMPLGQFVPHVERMLVILLPLQAEPVVKRRRVVQGKARQQFAVIQVGHLAELGHARFVLLGHGRQLPHIGRDWLVQKPNRLPVNG